MAAGSLSFALAIHCMESGIGEGAGTKSIFSICAAEFGALVVPAHPERSIGSRAARNIEVLNVNMTTPETVKATLSLI